MGAESHRTAGSRCSAGTQASTSTTRPPSSTAYTTRPNHPPPRCAHSASRPGHRPWWLRHSASSSWWRGTVLPHGDASRDELVGKITAAESFYAKFGVATRFQISPGACPARLDATVAERAYRRDSPMSLQTASTVDVQAQARPDRPMIRLNETPTTAWFEVWHAVHGHGSDTQIEWEMLGRVTAPSAYASALEGDEVIAVGRAVADAGWAGVFGMATLPEGRGPQHPDLAGRLGDRPRSRWHVPPGRARQRPGAPSVRQGVLHRGLRLSLPHPDAPRCLATLGCW